MYANRRSMTRNHYAYRFAARILTANQRRKVLSSIILVLVLDLSLFFFVCPFVEYVNRARYQVLV